MPTTSRSRCSCSLTRDEVEAALAAGEIEVLSWVTVVALALRALDV